MQYRIRSSCETKMELLEIKLSSYERDKSGNYATIFAGLRDARAKDAQSILAHMLPRK